MLAQCSPYSLKIPLESLAKESWTKQLSYSYSNLTDLIENQWINPLEAEKLAALGKQFKLRITPYYAQLIQNSLDCPIRKQAIPDLGENDPDLPSWAIEMSQRFYGRPVPWHPDAIGDVENLAAPRLTHRYFNRAILHVTSSCAVYCRFCFRKSHLGNHEESLYTGSLDPAFQYLAQHPEINELILTGGDPLSLLDLALQRIFEKTALLPSIQTLRIHSRMPVTLPYRFTPELLELFSKPWPYQLTLVSHFNHPLELTELALSKLKIIKKTGVTLLNQSVLLRGVNDSVSCLAQLFQGLYQNGVVPYYLHHPDWTPGTFHFRTSLERGKNLFSKVKGLVSGPALPHYVLDIPGGGGKIDLLGSSHQKKEDLPHPHLNETLQGALYQIKFPQIRKKQSQDSNFYFDLFFREMN